jgi:OmpA-OmpF porin, OOP family
MSHFSFFGLSRLAVAAATITLTMQMPLRAQTVQVFDQAPTLEQLRSIMIPESAANGVSRAIVMHAESSPSAAPVRQSASYAPDTEPSPASAVTEEAPHPHRVVKPQAEKRHGTVGFRINFAFDSSALPESGREMMDTVVALMRESPEVRVRIEGHTDAVGSPGYNMSLSQHRALSVGEYLSKQGIDPARLEIVGKGMSDPLTRNPYDADNRRVQFVRIG